MKRDYLKNLGIEDKDIIDSILDENSKDIGRAKGDADALRTRITELEGQLSAKEAENTTLRTQVGDTAALNERITQLEADKTNLTNDLNTKVTQIQKTHAIEGKIRDVKGKNIKAIMALLDMDKITYENNELGGIDEQLTALKGAEDSMMLFGESVPAGTNPSNPNANPNNNPATGKSFAEAVASALSANK